jgi:hypothetical protein
MRPEEIEELLRQRPLIPFRLYLTDGTSYAVKHPEMMILTRLFLDIGVPKAEGSAIAARVMRVSLLHIVRIENLISSTSQSA